MTVWDMAMGHTQIAWDFAASTAPTRSRTSEPDAPGYGTPQVVTCRYSREHHGKGMVAECLDFWTYRESMTYCPEKLALVSK